VIFLRQLNVSLNLVGLMGAYKEHYCMTMTYAILMTIGTIGTVVTAFRNPYYFITAAIDIIVCIIAYTFAHELHQRRRLTFATPIVLSTGAPLPPHTTVQMAPQPLGQQQYIEKGGQQYSSVAQEDVDETKNREIP